MTYQNEGTKTSRSGKETKDKKDIRVEDRREDQTPESKLIIQKKLSMKR